VQADAAGLDEAAGRGFVDNVSLHTLAVMVLLPSER
jgi:hypothetical protein